jgi:hypothetical protein
MEALRNQLPGLALLAKVSGAHEPGERRQGMRPRDRHHCASLAAICDSADHGRLGPADAVDFSRCQQALLNRLGNLNQIIRFAPMDPKLLACLFEFSRCLRMLKGFTQRSRVILAPAHRQARPSPLPHSRCSAHSAPLHRPWPSPSAPRRRHTAQGSPPAGSSPHPARVTPPHWLAGCARQSDTISVMVLTIGSCDCLERAGLPPEPAAHRSRRAALGETQYVREPRRGGL